MTAFRFQGTDGVRRKVAFAKEHPGLFAQQAFIKKDVITEEFMELYCYCAVRWMIDSEIIGGDETIAIGWDPRDTSGQFTSCAIQGVTRAGATVAAVGIMPTPAVVVYMHSIKAAGAIMITASHNPSSYNGIKIFTRNGLKLLPGDDVELSELVIDTDYLDVKMTRPSRKAIDHRAKATRTFIDFSLDRQNSWIEDETQLSKITLILDCANGAFSEIATTIAKLAGFGEVIGLNTRLDGSVNDNCGVAELEGMKVITHEMTESNGPIEGNLAIVTLFKIGRENRGQIKSGDKTVSAAIFDGDGDRFFRVDYDPFTDSCFVLTGDETSILQAEYRKDIDASKLFINTVESDLGVSHGAVGLGYKTLITAVGDKWILLKGILAAIRPQAPEDVYNKIESIATSGLPSAKAIEKILQDENLAFGTPDQIAFAIGAEESGHNITPALLKIDAREPSLVLAGNGMKSCLNTFAATSSGAISDILPIEKRLEHIKNPYAGGYKKTLYVFYVNKDIWRRDAPVWNEAKIAIMSAIIKALPGAEAKEMPLAEDSDMLYVKIIDSGAHFGSVFIRNSGTEDKIGVTLRSGIDKSLELLQIGLAAQKILFLRMKDFSKKMVIAEEKILLQAENDGVPHSPVGGLTRQAYDRLLNEMSIKEGVLAHGSLGARLTEMGEWYLTKIKGKKR